MASASLISLREESYHFSKRTVDVVLSVLGLVLLAPLMLIIAAAVKLTSTGPVIFKQERVGYNDKPFTIYKFRTMRTESERGSSVTSYHDERITWAGKIFRPFHFDELPQLWNILRGDMSFVGPRPCSVRRCEEMIGHISRFRDRFQVIPGLTGLAQVNKWHDTSGSTMLHCFNLDMEYLKTQSFLTDAWILWRTVIVVIRRNGN